MAIFAISDLHLSFGVDKPMNVFGKIWDNYEEKIKEDWMQNVTLNDTVIIPGDISWGIDFKEAYPDFKFINDLPGKKIILRGNHDYYFNTKTKVENFLKESNFDTIKLLHNNAYEVEDYILCGTRGWTTSEDTNKAEDKKIISREEGRLRLSLEDGKRIQESLKEKGIDKDIIVAMHYPPFNDNFMSIMQEYKVKLCIYGHLHGYGHKLVQEGNINGVECKMVSCDYTGFRLVKLFE